MCKQCDVSGPRLAVSAGHMNVGKLMITNGSSRVRGKDDDKQAPEKDTSPVMSDILACRSYPKDNKDPPTSDIAGPALYPLYQSAQVPKLISLEVVKVDSSAQATDALDLNHCDTTKMMEEMSKETGAENTLTTHVPNKVDPIEVLHFETSGN